MADRTATTAPACECCGEPATRQDTDGVWLCESDWRHLRQHARLERVNVSFADIVEAETHEEAERSTCG